MLYLRKPDGSFVPLSESSEVYRTSNVETVIVKREDGTVEQYDRECEPYPVQVRPTSVIQYWTREEREAMGIFDAVDAPLPEGKRRTGEPVLVMIEGQLTRVWDLEDAPPAPTRRILGYTIIVRLEAALGATAAKQLVDMVQTNDPVGYARLMSSPVGVAIDDQRLLEALARAKEVFPDLDIEAVLAE